MPIFDGSQVNLERWNGTAQDGMRGKSSESRLLGLIWLSLSTIPLLNPLAPS